MDEAERSGERPVDVEVDAGAGADGVVMELTEMLLGISSGGVGSSLGFLRELFDAVWSWGAVVFWLSLLLLLLLLVPVLMLLLLAV